MLRFNGQGGRSLALSCVSHQFVLPTSAENEVFLFQETLIHNSLLFMDNDQCISSLFVAPLLRTRRRNRCCRNLWLECLF